MTGIEVQDLIVSLTNSLAWPAFAVIALLMLRPILLKLSSLIETIKYKGLEMSFRRTVQDAAEKAEALVPEDEPYVEEAVPGTIDPDPRITILKSWASVETAIEDLATAHKDDLGRVDRVPTRRRVEMLRQADKIDNSLAGVLHDMGAVRNLIAHGGDIPLDGETVREFSRAAARVALIVEQQFGK